MASGNDLKELEEAGLLLLHGDVLLELDETCLVQVSESGDLLELGGTGLMQSFTGDLLELAGTGLMQSFTGDLLELGGTGLMQSFTGDLLELGGTGLMQSFTGDLLELVSTAMLQLSEDGDWLEVGLLQLSAIGDLMDVEDSGWWYICESTTAPSVFCLFTSDSAEVFAVLSRVCKITQNILYLYACSVHLIFFF